jgi:hypothetical protein
MLPPEDSDAAIGNLRDQVRHLEATLLLVNQRAAMFETAAAERLSVIEHGDQLLQARAQTIFALEEKVTALQQQLDRATPEQKHLENACREAKRGMEELANRERAQTREILELRNEGLLHSIIRRARSLFS